MIDHQFSPAPHFEPTPHGYEPATRDIHAAPVDNLGTYHSRFSAAGNLEADVAAIGAGTTDPKVRETAKGILTSINRHDPHATNDALAFARHFAGGAQHDPEHTSRPNGADANGTQFLDAQATQLGLQSGPSAELRKPSLDFGARDRFIPRALRMPGWYDRNNGR